MPCLHARETVFTIGNGYLCTRSFFEEGYPQSLPDTFIHGVYNNVPVLANYPDCLSLVIIINGERFRPDSGKILHYGRQLDLRNGVLSRLVHWRNPRHWFPNG